MSDMEGPESEPGKGTYAAEDEEPKSKPDPETEGDEGEKPAAEDKEPEDVEVPPPSSNPLPPKASASAPVSAPAKMSASASLASILGAEGESPLALKTAAIKLRQIRDTAAGITGKGDAPEIVGALLAVPTKLAKGARAAEQLAALRGRQDVAERWALVRRLSATGHIARTAIFADVVDDSGARRLDANGKPVVRIRTRYATMDLGVLRGLVTDLEGSAPKRPRNPFEPDANRAKAAAPAGAGSKGTELVNGEPTEAQIAAAMVNPAVQMIARQTGRDPRQVAAQHVKTLAASAGRGGV